VKCRARRPGPVGQHVEVAGWTEWCWAEIGGGGHSRAAPGRGTRVAR
jgi:hypothetical protein